MLNGKEFILEICRKMKEEDENFLLYDFNIRTFIENLSEEDMEKLIKYERI